jgi:hypothetical protein
MNLRRLFWVMLPLALVAMMLSAAACGGDDDDDNGDDDASEENGDTGGGGGGSGPDGDSDADDEDDSENGDEPDSSDDDGSTDDDGSSDDDGSDDDDGGGSSGSGGTGGGSDDDGLELLQQTANALNDGTYFVVYRLQAEGLDGTFTFASEPPSTLFGLEGEFEGESGTFMIINDEEFLWFCSDSGGNQACLKLKAGDLGFIPVEIPTALQADELAQSFVNAPGVTAEPAPGQTIAGIEGDCYNVTSEGDTALICIGGGVILLMQGSIDGMDLSFEALEVELDPGQIEITVPDWPVQDLTALGN